MMGNIIRNILYIRRSLMSKVPQGVYYYSGSVPSIEQIKKEIVMSSGGSIDLSFNNQTGIATLVLNNPKIKNAFTGSMMVELSDAVDKLEQWDKGKAVLIYGAGSGFCSGADLNFIRKHGSSPFGMMMSTLMTDTLTRLSRLPVVSVAFIHGSGAIGGGAEVSVACDWRIMTQESRIGLVHSKMGIIPAWGGCSRTQAIIGHSAALDLIVSGRVLTAQQALDMKLINNIVDNSSEAITWLESKLATTSVEVVRAAKTALLALDLNTENRLFTPLFGGPANQQALQQNIKHKLLSTDN